MKSAAYKEKVCLCYVALIERLAHKLKNFRDLERLVQSVVRFLSEGAVEVRNQAKYAVLTLRFPLFFQKIFLNLKSRNRNPFRFLDVCSASIFHCNEAAR